MVKTSSFKLYSQIRDEIKSIYKQESDAIAMLLVEDLTGYSPTDILIDKQFLKSDETDRLVSTYIEQLKNEVPVQYILGYAYFNGYRFRVNKETLIPRPETEELVGHVSSFIKGKIAGTRILDIGTGSGCIAISLALTHPGNHISAIDVSAESLDVARYNAEMLNANVEFVHTDIEAFSPAEKFNVIVSNPPYVTESEKSAMSNNVLLHEPFLALFVSDQDPLKYYRQILKFSEYFLRKNGGLFLEINENYGDEVNNLLGQNNFINTKIIKDLNNKDRFVTGYKP